MVKNDIVDGLDAANDLRISWPREDCIRWVEWRIRELTIQNGQYIDGRGKWLLEENAAGGRRLALGDKVADYAVWLSKVRDKLSWHQIAYRFFPSATEEDIEKYELRVRRAFKRVEQNHEGSRKYKPKRFFENDKLLLQAVMQGAIPDYISNEPEPDPQS